MFTEDEKFIIECVFKTKIIKNEEKRQDAKYSVDILYNEIALYNSIVEKVRGM